jgi:polysaccharide export outer membrane protein
MLVALVVGTGLSLDSAAAQAGTSTSGASAKVVLQPGDRVRLKVWREPDLSGDFDVADDGFVVFPKVGRIDLRQITTDSLTSLLLAGYSGSLRNPSVEITVLRRVNVQGSVRSPGLYYVDPTITVSGALAMAGGISPEGNRNRIELLRGGDSRPIRLVRESRLTDTSLQSGDQLMVRERSWLARNTGFVSAGLTAAAVVFAALIR